MGAMSSGESIQARLVLPKVLIIVATLICLSLIPNGLVPPSTEGLHSVRAATLGSTTLGFSGIDSASASLGADTPYIPGGGSASAPYWTNLTALPAPSPRAIVSMTYDWADHYDLLFGGMGASGPLNDTWTYANGVWDNITSTAGTPPVAQYGMAMTFDALDGYVLAWGCPGANPNVSSMCNDTWSFVHGKWNKVAAVVDAPSGGWSNLIPVTVPYTTMVYDAADSYVVLTDGPSTWEYSDGVWTPFCSSPTNCTRSIPGPPGGSAAYDASDGYVLAFAGNYTWKFLGGTWTNITTSAGTPPPYRVTSSMAYDNASGGVLLFGGSSETGRPLNDTWLFRDGSWSVVSAAPSPPARYEGGIAYDSADAGIVVFGGIGAAGTDTTWIWGNDPPMAGLAISAVPANPLPDGNVSFSVSFVGGVGPFSYSWRFGDGTTSAAPDPIHAFGTEGYYSVQLWVNDSAGHSSNTLLRVHVYIPLGIETLLASPNPAILGQPVNFVAVATGGTLPYTFSWVFGDGGVGGNLSNVTHIYTTSGPFVAQVSVVDALGGTAHADLTLSIRLEALAGSTATTGAAPLTVDLVGQAEGGVTPYSFEWAFGDGTTSTAQNPSHTYNSTGLFTVILTVIDSSGNRSTSSLTIQVGLTSAGSTGETSWLAEVAIVAAAVVTVGAVWGVSALYRRSQRREGERWIEELTREPESRDRGQNR